jgi:hypothetical protein
MILYAYYNPENGSFLLALALVIFTVFAMFIYILAVAPEKEDTCIVRILKFFHPCLKILRFMDAKHHEKVEISVFVRCFNFCCCCIKRHVSTDWLIASWMITIGCFLSIWMSIALLVYECHHHNKRGIFDYATCLVDMILFFIGSCYITAGMFAYIFD